MSRLPKWTMSKDGVKRCTVKFERRVGLDECTIGLAYIIYWDNECNFGNDFDADRYKDRYSKKTIIDVVKQELKEQGEHFYYQEDITQEILEFAGEEAIRIFIKEYR